MICAEQIISTYGSGLGTVKAPCACEAVDIISVAHGFSFQYADVNGVAIGDAVNAAAYTTTYFEFKADNGGKGFCWAAGATIGFITGTAADVIGIRPRVIGH